MKLSTLIEIKGGGGLEAMKKTSNATPKLSKSLQLICKQIQAHELDLLKEKYLHQRPFLALLQFP